MAKRTEARSITRWVLWRRWVLANILGELGGFGMVAIVGSVAAWLIGESAQIDTIMLIVMIPAGAIEGMVVGWAQWRTLRRVLPELPRCAWVLTTILGAGAAWAVGMAVAIAIGNTDIAETTAMMVMGLLIPVFGTILGLAQWVVFRRYVGRAGWWILANAAAWTVGMTLIFGGMTLLMDDAAGALRAVVGIVSGVAAGAFVGAIHGLALIWLLRARLEEGPRSMGLQSPGR